MILNLADHIERKKAEVYFTKLLDQSVSIELKKIAQKRTMQQNKYIHALFQLFGSNFGYSLEEAKQVIKLELGYTYEKDSYTLFVRTSEMNTKELSEFVYKFRNYSAAQGFYLPSSDEMGDNWDYYAREIDRAEAIEKRYSY